MAVELKYRYIIPAMILIPFYLALGYVFDYFMHHQYPTWHEFPRNLLSAAAFAALWSGWRWFADKRKEYSA
jgi:hypothetical protein